MYIQLTIPTCFMTSTDLHYLIVIESSSSSLHIHTLFIIHLFKQDITLTYVLYALKEFIEYYKSRNTTVSVTLWTLIRHLTEFNIGCCF